ncbi:MAG: YIP1 family protein [Roseovarius sp.]|nr:YIP1 family protein [Roseovarius sp.]
MERRMTQADFKALLLETLFRPREAARALIGFGLPQQTLWMALALMSVLNAIVYSVSLRLAPPMDPTTPTLMPPAFHSPLLFTLFLLGALVITVYALFWAFLAASPLILLHGLVAGFVGPGPGLQAVGLLWLLVFLWFWVSGLIEAEWSGA